MTDLRIYLARHGQDADNAAGILNGHRDQPLSDIGIQQAQTVASKILKADLKFDAIYSSPLQRAHRTAEIIADQCGSSSVQILDSLIERDFGCMTGTPTKEIKERCSPNDLLCTDTITYFLSPDEAETFPDLIVRAEGVIEEISKRHETTGGSILLVTHGDFGKMMYAAYYKLSWESVLKQFHFGNSEVLLLAKASKPDQAHVFEIEQYNH